MGREVFSPTPFETKFPFHGTDQIVDITDQESKSNQDLTLSKFVLESSKQTLQAGKDLTKCI